ncbi:MAG: zinc ABC transporter substrate-binding protein [Gammaproteobacteria bacterium]
MKRLIALVLLALAPLTASHAALRVFACEPEWAALTHELGGSDVQVKLASTAGQDPHHIQARPSLIAAMRRADLLVCTGAGLEVGWLPVLLRRAGNGAVQPGQPGYFEAAAFVRLRDVPTRLDRAEGDVHPAGNPHIQTDPRNIARVAAALGQRLMELDSAHRAAYGARLEHFQKRWRQAMERWDQEAADLRGVPVAVQHKGWVYLNDWLGLKEVATLEPKPGVPPSAAHLAAVLEQLKSQPARLVIHAAYQDPRPSQWLAQHAHIPDVELPFTVGGTPGAGDLFGLFDDTLRRLREGLK